MAPGLRWWNRTLARPSCVGVGGIIVQSLGDGTGSAFISRATSPKRATASMTARMGLKSVVDWARAAGSAGSSGKISLPPVALT
jgi:hypothetical protein